MNGGNGGGTGNQLYIQALQQLAPAVYKLQQSVAALPTGTLTSSTFAALPATPVLGMLAVVTDSNTVTWGANIAGGSTNNVLAFYNGVHWTVAGK